MTSIIQRPALFEALGDEFVDAFGNVDVTPIVDGVAGPCARGILRQVRVMDLVEEAGIAVEGVTHTLSLKACVAETLVADRDSVSIEQTIYAVRGQADDGRAMIKLLLTGDL